MIAHRIREPEDAGAIDHFLYVAALAETYFHDKMPAMLQVARSFGDDAPVKIESILPAIERLSRLSEHFFLQRREFMSRYVGRIGRYNIE